HLARRLQRLEVAVDRTVEVLHRRLELLAQDRGHAAVERRLAPQPLELHLVGAHELQLVRLQRCQRADAPGAEEFDLPLHQFEQPAGDGDDLADESASRHQFTPSCALISSRATASAIPIPPDRAIVLAYSSWSIER